MSRRAWLDAAMLAVVLAAVVLVSYWRVVDTETYLRLAIGRVTAAAGPFLKEDPFLFSLPGLHWRNQEWLGDLLLYGVHHAAGEVGLVALKLVLLGAGFTLLYRLARVHGGGPLLTATLILVALLGADRRFIERDELHLYWLAPLYGLVLRASAQRPRIRLWLLPLGVLWANLHGSFVLGPLMLGAAGAQALIDRDRARLRALAPLLALQPLLPMISPDGPHAYGQVWDHFRYGKLYASIISEWRPPGAVPLRLSDLPLHVFALVGLASFLPRANRRNLEGLVLLVAGLAMAYRSQRFIMVLAVLAVPPLTGNLTRIVSALGARARPILRVAGPLALAGAALLLVPSIRAARARPHAASRPTVPAAAARWLAAHGPAGGRLFPTFSGSPWFLWEAPQVRVYIHTHFSFDGAFFARYFEQVLPHPRRFDDEVRRCDIDLALVEQKGDTHLIRDHLDASSDWTPVYMDAFFALFARKVPRNQPLIATSGYRVLRPRLAFEYLDDAPPDALAAELARLEREGPPLARAIRGYLHLRDGRPDQALPLLASAVPELPSSGVLSAYLASAYLRMGMTERARRVVADGLREFPMSPRLRELARQMASTR